MAYFTARFVPVSMAAAVLLPSAPGELLAALYRLTFPSPIVVPLAVGLRFAPCIAREVLAIRDAMNLRGISLTPLGILKRPVMTVECALLPLMMRSIRLSDELAACTGIDNPGGRASLRALRIGSADVFAMATFVVLALTAALNDL